MLPLSPHSNEEMQDADKDTVQLGELALEN
jgi:hypothetical protein